SWTPDISPSVPCSRAPLLPVTPMAVRCAPGMGCARYPSDSMRSQTARTCSSVACAFITTSMDQSPWNCSVYNQIVTPERGSFPLQSSLLHLSLIRFQLQTVRNFHVRSLFVAPLQICDFNHDAGGLYPRTPCYQRRPMVPLRYE